QPWSAVPARSCPPEYCGPLAAIARRPAQAIGFGIQQCVQRLLDLPAHHLAQMVPEPGFINADDVPHTLPLFALGHVFLPPPENLEGAANPESAKDPVRYRPMAA